MVVQFQQLGAAQREAILKALNEDAHKLIAEYGVDAARNPALQRLQEEMRQCNRLFAELSARVENKGQCTNVFIPGKKHKLVSPDGLSDYVSLKKMNTFFINELCRIISLLTFLVLLLC